MSGTEDYLDGLLNSISEKDMETKKKTGSETMQTEEDIMNDMENDLLSKEAEDDFLKQFEKELENEKSAPKEEKTDDFFNNLDQIVDGAGHNDDDDFMMDTLGDIPGIDDMMKKEDPIQTQEAEKGPDEQPKDIAKADGSDGLSDFDEVGEPDSLDGVMDADIAEQPQTLNPADDESDVPSDSFGIDDADSAGLDDFGDIGGDDTFGDAEAEETAITADGGENTAKKKAS